MSYISKYLMHTINLFIFPWCISCAWNKGNAYIKLTVHKDYKDHIVLQEVSCCQWRCESRGIWCSDLWCKLSVSMQDTLHACRRILQTAGYIRISHIGPGPSFPKASLAYVDRKFIVRASLSLHPVSRKHRCVMSVVKANDASRGTRRALQASLL